MAKVIQIALHGNNVLTETDPDKFALFADQSVDYILIKEKARGTASVNINSTQSIGHGLAYVPFALVFVEITAGVWKKLYSSPIDGSGIGFQINSTNVILSNGAGGVKNFAYYIFYDNIT